MGWNRSLGHPEQTGKEAGHLQTRRTPATSGSIGTHRKATAHSDPSSQPSPSPAHPSPEQPAENLHSAKVRTGIVSVNGCDVGIMHCRRP